MDKVPRHLYAWLCDEDGDYAEDEEFHATAEPFVDTYGVEP